MESQVVFKSVVVAAIFLGIIALAGLAFQPGSVGTVGGGGSSWSGGGDNDWDDD